MSQLGRIGLPILPSLAQPLSAIVYIKASKAYDEITLVIPKDIYVGVFVNGRRTGEQSTIVLSVGLIAWLAKELSTAFREDGVSIAMPSAFGNMLDELGSRAGHSFQCKGDAEPLSSRL
jgi:hypothetical protein